MIMSPSHLIAANSPTEHRSLRRNVDASEGELEIRIQNLEKLVDSVHAALRQVSFSGKPSVLDLMNDLHVKIKTIHNMLRVARLLSEPARESMLSRVRGSLNELEETIAVRLDVEMT
jgi:hypothetical protein